MGSGASIGAHADITVWISRIPCFQTLDRDKIETLAMKINVSKRSRGGEGSRGGEVSSHVSHTHTRTHTQVMTFQKGEKIIVEGQVGTLFGILVAGTVQISALGPTGLDVALCSQERGFYFGEGK